MISSPRNYDSNNYFVKTELEKETAIIRPSDRGEISLGFVTDAGGRGRSKPVSSRSLQYGEASCRASHGDGFWRLVTDFLYVVVFDVVKRNLPEERRPR